MSNLSTRKNILLIGCVLLSCRLIVFSQTSTAVLQGTVSDPAGALVPRAVVKIQQLGHRTGA